MAWVNSTRITQIGDRHDTVGIMSGSGGLDEQTLREIREGRSMIGADNLDKDWASAQNRASLVPLRGAPKALPESCPAGSSASAGLR